MAEKRIRTPEGAEKYGGPIGSVIGARRGRTALARLRDLSPNQLTLFDKPDKVTPKSPPPKVDPKPAPKPKPEPKPEPEKRLAPAGGKFTSKITTPVTPEVMRVGDIIRTPHNNALYKIVDIDSRPGDSSYQVGFHNGTERIQIPMERGTALQEMEFMERGPNLATIEGLDERVPQIPATELRDGDAVVFNGPQHYVLTGVTTDDRGMIEAVFHNPETGEATTSWMHATDDIAVTSRFDTSDPVRAKAAFRANARREAFRATVEAKEARAAQADFDIRAEAATREELERVRTKNADDDRKKKPVVITNDVAGTAPAINEIFGSSLAPGVADARAKAVEAIQGQYGGLKLDKVTIYKDDNTWFNGGYSPVLTIEGKIYDPNGEPNRIDGSPDSVGSVKRRIGLDPEGKLVVENDWLAVRVKGTGFASAFYPAMEAWYKESGVDRVQIHAALDDGGYVWGKAGFDWNVKQFEKPDIGREALHMSQQSGIPEQDKLILRGISKMFLSEDPLDWPSPRELSTLQGSDGKLGRRLMRGTSWYGVKALNPPDTARHRRAE